MSGKPMIDARTSGILYLIAGAVWVGAGMLGEQIAFYGIGVMFLLFGLAAMAKARKEKAS